MSTVTKIKEGFLIIRVQYILDDTPFVDTFTASEAEMRLFPDGRASVHLVDGLDQTGQAVIQKLYRRCEAITRMPAGT